MLPRVPCPALLLLWTIASGPAAAQARHHGEDQSPTMPTTRVLADCRDVDYRGELGTRYAAATCNLLTRPERYPVESFRANIIGTGEALWLGWPGDQLGRWFSVLHVAQGHGWTPAAANRAAIGEAVLPLQTDLGNFGPVLPLDQDDARIPSGNAFALRGLVDAYEDTGEDRYLDAARRLARYFEAIAPHWRTAQEGHLHEFYGHCLDGLVRLYGLGGDEWALRLARDLAANVGRAPHTHHTLSMYRGVLELYRVTGDPELLARTDDYLGWLNEHRLVSGGVPESMPASAQDEGCGLADYVIVNLMAFSLTGRDAYLDDAEHVLVNHFFMNQFHTGGFGHRAFAQDIVGGKCWQGWEGRYGSENPGCCSLWGQWALGELGRYIVTQSSDAVEVNLYPAAAVRVPERGLVLEIESDFPRMSTVRITVHADRTSRFPLRLRIPPWAEEVAATCNGKPLGRPAAGERLVVERKWRSGDVVELQCRSEPRLVPWPSGGDGMVAVFDGPLCLALSSGVGDVDAFHIVRADARHRPLRDDQGHVLVWNAEGQSLTGLAPMADDWLAPDVHEPHRLRLLFYQAHE